MTEKGTKIPHIVISDREPGLPYSKGLMASQVMVTGLSPFRAYQVAEEIEERLRERGSTSLTTDELAQMALEVLTEIAGERYAKNFLRWREVEKPRRAAGDPDRRRDGGREVDDRHAARRTPGHRPLRRHRRDPRGHAVDVLAGADAHAATRPRSRPTPRSASRRRARPTRSSSGSASRRRPWRSGINALIERAALEGTSIIIEGAHVVPGFFDLDAFDGRILAVPVVITVEDEERHRSPLRRARATSIASRPAQRYAEGFDNIRRLQRYVKSQALSHGVPIIPNYSFDQSLAAVIDLVMERATARAAAVAVIPDPTTAADAQTRQEGRDEPMRLFLDTGEHRRDPRDQPLGRPDGRHHEPVA